MRKLCKQSTQRSSGHPFVCAVWPFRTACFMNGNKKILDGHLPVTPRPRFLHNGFRQPLALCMRKKNLEKPFLHELEPFQKFTIPLENLQFHWSMYPYERGSVSTVVCHLFVVRVPKRSAVCSQALCVVSGEASANFERPSQSHFSLDSREQAILV